MNGPSNASPNGRGRPDHADKAREAAAKNPGSSIPATGSPPPDPQHGALAWFLGPKAENGPLFEELLLEIVRDYLHWRRNYFPGDPILISRAMQHDMVQENDTLIQNVHTMLADLRRNFPFYSPRYLGHQLSDTTMPSMLGQLAGMLFNPNNVTPGAAPVTTEMEILACNAILEMLGLTPPPPPPPEGTDAEAYYREAGEHEYGWAHLTSGGTVANIEALWAARQVRYAPLSIKSVARDLGLNVPVMLANGTPLDIQQAADRDLLLMPVHEAIELLPKYVAALRAHRGYESLPGQDLGRAAWRLLNESPNGLSHGVGTLFARHPPVILVAGTRHYSITKAADIIGVGAANVVQVAMDEHFRMDPADLRSKLTASLIQGRIPLAVIATAGTTEEGSIDPIDQVLALRSDLESRSNASFWLHADAAWGGYVRCLFRGAGDAKEEYRGTGEHLAPSLASARDLIASTRAFVSEEVPGPAPDCSTRLSWPTEAVGRAVLSLSGADSITIDPHKLGYAPYPSGCIAFRNDHVRLFLQQRSPYVSATTPDPLIPVPPRHADVGCPVRAGTGFGRRGEVGAAQGAPPASKVFIDSFSPFILEGSRPGAAATALWLSVQSVPLNREGHGRVIREALLAAQWLYECLAHSEHVILAGGQDLSFVPLTPGPPDTSIVTFTIKHRSATSLGDMNALTQAVHDRFSIQSELGERRYSYAQPFFLSGTHMESSEYPVESLAPFFARCGLGGFAEEYQAEGLVVLRASVMSPYLGPSRRIAGQDFIRIFVQELAQAALVELAREGGGVREHRT